VVRVSIESGAIHFPVPEIHMSCKRTTLAAVLAALPFSLLAAEATLTPVVVTASKEQAPPLAATVDAAGVQTLRAATSDTASLLRDVPGVSLYGAGGVSSLPSIHGLADDRLRIKVDGMDLIASCPNHMNPALSYLDPSNVGSLKVYAGITPVSVGGDSIGGTIVADTPAPVFAAPGQGSLFKGEAGAFYRSNGNVSGGNLAATYATESFSISYAGATAKSDNYEAANDFKSRIYTSAANAPFTGRAGHTLPLDEVGSTAYETRNHTLGFAFRGGNHLFEAKFGYQDLPYQLYPNQRMDMLDNEQKRLNLRYLGRFDWGSLEARAYHEKVDHYMDFGDDKRWWYSVASGGNRRAQRHAVHRPISRYRALPACRCTREGKTTGASVKASIDLTQQDLLRIGGELQQYRLDDWWPPPAAACGPNTFLNINNGERDRTALYRRVGKALSPQWMTLLGLRYERVSMDAGIGAWLQPRHFPTARSRGNDESDDGCRQLQQRRPRAKPTTTGT
jgi:iron complex outermembrane receptor protein